MTALRLTPKYVAAQAWIESILAGLFGFAFIGLYPAVFMFSGAAKRLNVEPNLLLCWVGIVASIILPMWGYIYLKRNNYRQTYYDFGDDRLIYFEGFLNIKRKEILYHRILEINFAQSVIQRPFGVGTVLLLTAATEPSTARGQGGIKIRDIDSPETMYERIKSVVHKGASGQNALPRNPGKQ